MGAAMPTTNTGIKKAKAVGVMPELPTVRQSRAKSAISCVARAGMVFSCWSVGGAFAGT